MSLESEKPNFLLSKLSGLFFIVVGFLIAASGYRSESTGYMIGGIILLAIGIIILVRKVIRRNPAA